MDAKRMRACSPFEDVIANNVIYNGGDELSSTQSVVHPRSDPSSAAASVVANDETMRTDLTEVLNMDELHRNVRSAIQKGLKEACDEALLNPLRVSTVCQQQSWSIAAAVMRELEPFVNSHEQTKQASFFVLAIGAFEKTDATQNTTSTVKDYPAAGDVENEDEVEVAAENVTEEKVERHDSEDSDSGSTESSDSERDGSRWKLEELCQKLAHKKRSGQWNFLKCVLCGKGRPEARHMMTFHLKNGKRETPYPCNSARCPFGFFRQTDAKQHTERAGKNHSVYRRHHPHRGRYYHYSAESPIYRKLFNMLGC